MKKLKTLLLLAMFAVPVMGLHLGCSASTEADDDGVGAEIDFGDDD